VKALRSGGESPSAGWRGTYYAPKFLNERGTRVAVKDYVGCQRGVSLRHLEDESNIATAG
jgi:hypothetical protein